VRREVAATHGHTDMETQRQEGSDKVTISIKIADVIMICHTTAIKQQQPGPEM